MRDVLIADDDRFMVQTLCDVLSLHGWNTRGVASGEEALEASEEESYACIIMDIKMDGQDGFSTMQRIKRRNRTTPVFLMTAYTADELLAEVTRKGTLQVFDETITIDETVSLIERANSRGDPVLLVNRRAGFLDNLHDELTRCKLPVVRTGSNLDLLAEFERQPPGVTLVQPPLSMNADEKSYLITGLDAGVWVALSGHLPNMGGALSHEITLADAFFRKPLAIPQLVEQLNAVASG